MRRVLGITGLAHDAAVAIVEDGAIVFALENERVTRRKGEWTFPTAGLDVALRCCGLRHEDIHEIYYYWDDRGALKRSLIAEVGNANALGWRVVGRMCSRIRASRSNREVVERLRAIWSGNLPPITFVDHHKAHAKYSFAASGYDAAACLVVDGRGEFATASIYDCDKDELVLKWQQPMPASLGYVYGAVTQHLGFEPLADEYRVMGLAPYGDEEQRLDEWFSKLIWFDGRALRVNSRLIRYHIDERTSQPWLSKKAHAELGPPRGSSEAIEPKHANLARAMQKRYETVFLELASYAKNLTGRSRLVLGGGCAMNSVANGKLNRAEVFEAIFTPAAPGDQGCAAGAALTAFDFETTSRQHKRNSSALLGPSYSDELIAHILGRNKLNYSAERAIGRAAELIAAGRIGAIFDGCLEFGPRALGGRSIVADPRDALTRERLNEVIKMREAFRPFAGAVFDDCASKYFHNVSPSPYMNLVVEVRDDARDHIPAIVHVDGSCRIQTVCRGESRFAELLAQFERLTGVAVMVNTSFNVKGEPIVMTPEDALRCFYGTGLDFLLIGSFLLEKPH